MMIEPIRLDCGHRFCGHCLKNASSAGKKCPLCRYEYKVGIKRNNIDLEFERRLKLAYPDEFKRRCEDLARDYCLLSSIVDLRFAVGNKYTLLDKDKCKFLSDGTAINHRWQAYVELLPVEGVDQPPTQIMHKLISHITFKVYETYCKAQMVTKITPKPGDGWLWMKRLAWGAFDLPTVIYFRPELKIKPIYCRFMLKFGPEGRRFIV